jgi:ferric-dicitrate binding protein FerR (iron transport regulator)
MNDQDEHHAHEATRAAESDEGLERLLRLAGPRQTVSADRAARVRTVVHDAWLSSVRARTIRRRAIVIMGALAASAVLAVVWRPRDAAHPLLPPRPAGHLLAATGLVTTGAKVAPLRPGDGLTIGTTMHTGAGALATVVLSGGGELRVDAETVVALRGERELRVERGAVYIDSGTAGESITVRTAFGVVRDVGTRFEVRVRDRGLRVRVRDGAVQYERDALRGGATAGTELVVSAEGSVETRSAAAYGSEWEWVQRAAPTFRVEASTLAAFLRWVSHEGGWRVQFLDAALERAAATITLHGSIEGLTTDEALAVVLPTCGLAHRTEGDRLIVFATSASSGGKR